MKVRLVAYLVPVTPEKINVEGLPNILKGMAANMMTYRQGTPIIKNKIVDFPDNMLVSLQSGLVMPVTEGHSFQVGLVDWDYMETRGPQVKILFNASIDKENLATLLQEMKWEGGWEEGCSCRTCRNKGEFSDWMKKAMGADPEKT